jgi:UDP-N-acetylmuramate--alanine ligase
MRHKVKQVHFVGIGGSGMSGIAEVLLTLRYKVSGSDLSENASTRRLRQLGAKIHIGHDEAHIAGSDAVVVSTAVREDNPEVVAARARKIPLVPRALMLAELMRLKQGIAVAGTHGKTTTTSLVASVLAEGGLDPTFVIGGRLEAAGSNARLGAGEFIVVEADESDASFLYLQPTLAVVTNIDADHMETYDQSLDKLRQAFVDFLQRLPFYGVAVLCADDPNVRSIMPQLTKPVTTYGLSPDAHVRAVDVTASGTQMRFRAVRSGEGKAAAAEIAVTLNLPGAHNVRNALAAIAVGAELGVPEAAIVKALAEFKGKVRLAGGGSFTLVDDYGHHPAEMAATLAAARGAFPKRRILLAFQPHRYTRTRDCFEDFVSVLSTADALVLT